MKMIKIALLVVCLCFSMLGLAAKPVNINTADAVTLSKVLKGVGITRAKAIVAYRQKHGPFKSTDELVKVKGVGNHTLEVNRDNIVVK